MSADRTMETPASGESDSVMQKRVDRRRALNILLGGVAEPVTPAATSR